MSNVVNFADRFGFLEVRSERQGDVHVITLSGEVIVEAHARSRADGDRLVLTCAPAAVQRIFDMTDLTGRLPFTS